MLEASVGDDEVADWRDRVTCHFGALTVETLACPLGHILAHRRPDNLGADGLTRAFHAGMPKSVNGVKYSLAERQRYEWSSWTVANVNDEASVADVDLLEVQSRSCVVPDATEVRVESLLSGDGIPVDAEGGDGVNNASQILHGVLAASGCVLRSRRRSC